MLIIIPTCTMEARVILLVMKIYSGLFLLDQDPFPKGNSTSLKINGLKKRPILLKPKKMMSSSGIRDQYK